MGDFNEITNFQNSRDEGDRARGAHPYNPCSKNYDMTGKRLMYVFNHSTFQNTDHFKVTPRSRNGTEKDVQALKMTFGRLGFQVEIKNNAIHENIIDKLTEICALDHRGTSCIAIVILTHGEAGGILYAADRKYELSDVIRYIVNEKSLAGKPKLFFIQACRGHFTDEGQRIQFDGTSCGYTMPTHADCLVMMPCYDDHVSFRSNSGSWMIQALCEVLDENETQDLNILNLITLVNNRVAFKSSYSDSKENHEKKQIPETKFTLTKYLKF